MRHLKVGRKLGRSTAHRKALYRNLVTALIQRERIRTTLAKAKELRKHAEKTITLGKKGTLHARRQALKNISGKEAFIKLFSTLSERYASRAGGYTRIMKIGNRRGDDAPMAIIELVDRENEAKAPEPKKGKKAATKKSEGKAESKGAKKEGAEKKEKKPAKEKKEEPEKKKKVAKKKEDNKE